MRVRAFSLLVGIFAVSCSLTDPPGAAELSFAVTDVGWAPMVEELPLEIAASGPGRVSFTGSVTMGMGGYELDANMRRTSGSYVITISGTLTRGLASPHTYFYEGDVAGLPPGAHRFRVDHVENGTRTTVFEGEVEVDWNRPAESLGLEQLHKPVNHCEGSNNDLQTAHIRRRPADVGSRGFGSVGPSIL
jgi:hypothetical protein